MFSIDFCVFILIWALEGSPLVASFSMIHPKRGSNLFWIMDNCYMYVTGRWCHWVRTRTCDTQGVHPLYRFKLVCILYYKIGYMYVTGRWCHWVRTRTCDTQGVHPLYRFKLVCILYYKIGFSKFIKSYCFPFYLSI